jgi:hypothetical protein
MIQAQYQTIGEMQKIFQGGFGVVHSRKKLNEFIDEFQTHKGVITRGSGEAKFKLYNSAQLFCHQNELCNSKFEYFEYITQILDNIKVVKNEVVPRFFETMGIASNFYSYRRFARHHGAPVPILDFSRDLKVALYFAASSSGPLTINCGIGNYFAIYSISETAQNVFFSPFEVAKKKLSWIEDKLNDGQRDEIFTGMIKDNPFMLIEQDDPSVIPCLIYTTFRIVNQSGLFLSDNSPDKPLERYIPEIINWINVILIHKSLKEFLLDRLAKDCITEGHVYPNPDKIVADAKREIPC